jgi:hypothetical protein
LTNELFFFIVCPHDSNDCMNFESVSRAVTEISLHPQAFADHLLKAKRLQAVPNTDWRSVDDLRR